MWSKIINLIKKITSLVKKAEDIKDKVEEALPQEEKQEQTTNDDAIFAELNWMYGGFRAKGAVRDDNAVIANLSIHSNGMSYSWQAGGCEVLGAKDRSDPDQTLACLFCLINGKWVGGKFDWISTSRVTRDFHNIATGYNGWDAAAIDKAEGFRFVIVSKDGSKRTNVIES